MRLMRVAKTGRGRLLNMTRGLKYIFFAASLTRRTITRRMRDVPNVILRLVRVMWRKLRAKLNYSRKGILVWTRVNQPKTKSAFS